VARPKLRDPWDITSKAALLSAFQALDADRYGPAIDQLAANLIALQSTDGSWGSHTQATAYSLEALTDIGGRKARSSSRRAALWLANSLGPEGGWPSNASDSGRNIEAQAEALSAYVAYLKTS
jgi:squalene cyclase